MALIIEDGTGKADAQSYVTVAEARTFAASRGISLPIEDNEVEILLVRGSDYLLTVEGQLQGRRKSSAQALSFPRIGLTINCEPFASDAIPQTVKYAQIQASMEAFSTGTDLSPSTTKYPIYREKVEGAVERQFMTPRQLSTMPDGSYFQPTFPKIDAFLFPLLRGNECPGTGEGVWLRAVRM